MRIVIIEDENLTANDLAKTLKIVDEEIEIVTFLSSVEESIEFLKKEPHIDLIFSDIELGDGLSFDIFEKLKITIPIVFCTAYNHYALEAFKTTGIDYILKPFSKITIENTLIKYQNLKEKFATPKDDYIHLISLIKQTNAYQNPSVLIHQGEKIIPINGRDIAFFLFEDSYSFALTFDGKKHILTQSMETLENIFSPEFFRTNRQYLVNRKAVKEASHFFNRKIVINLTIPHSEKIIVGKLRVSAFMQWLANQ